MARDMATAMPPSAVDAKNVSAKKSSAASLKKHCVRPCQINRKRLRHRRRPITMHIE